jgi:ubiquinone/menaquinone biosynthesis C-methylase UbiE
MSARVDLYNNAYSNPGSEIYAQIRVETYGRDLGQTSWVTAEESDEIPKLLQLWRESSVLEVGSGSGGYALHLAEHGCNIVGLDVNEHGVNSAKQLASDRGLAARARFELCDASKPLPFHNEHFDAVFSNDVLCHVPGRLNVLREMFRVLKPGARMLFSDALVIGGIISHEEVAIRSSIGYYLFSPPGENERLIAQAGFRELISTDTTENAASISKRRRDAREKWKKELVALEGQENYEGLQAFLACVHRLTAERRLRRYLYLAEKGR